MLAKYVTRPLVDDGAAGVAETIARLDEYGLSKDDLFETLPDLQLGGAKVPGLDALDTKAKTHFTKTYNAGTHGSQALQPQNLVAKKKKRKADDDARRAHDDDDYVDDDDDEEDLDVSMFSKKKKKAPAKKAPAKKAPAARKPAAKKSKKG
ncbi:DNA clamp loader protein [Aureococcus anophagefferens]|nr:DNA clamp loader protein [Aureococcus anophagefferens]